MDPSVYDGLLDVMDHRNSFSPLLSEKGSVSNLPLRTTLNIIPLFHYSKLASLNKFLAYLTYIWHRFVICMTLSYLVKISVDSDYFENTREGWRSLPPSHTHTPPDPLCRCIIR